jgi:hypothetical protein
MSRTVRTVSENIGLDEAATRCGDEDVWAVGIVPSNREEQQSAGDFDSSNPVLLFPYTMTAEQTCRKISVYHATLYKQDIPPESER